MRSWSRSRRFWPIFTALVVVMVGLSTFPTARPASAGPEDWLYDWAQTGIPQWAGDRADDIYNGCAAAEDWVKDVPASWFGEMKNGTGTGFIGGLGLVGGAGAATISAAGATVGTAGAIGSGGVGLAIGVGVGGFCGTITQLGPLFVDSWGAVLNDGTIPDLEYSDVEPCVTHPTPPSGFVVGDFCVGLRPPAGSTRLTSAFMSYDTVTNQYGISSSTSAPIQFRLPNGATSLTYSPLPTPNSEGFITVAMPCASVWNECGIIPQGLGIGYQPVGINVDGIGNQIAARSAASGIGGYLAIGPIIPTMSRDGVLLKTRTQMWCKRPSDGDEEYRVEESANYRASVETELPPPSVVCPSGYAWTKIVQDRLTARGGNTSAATWIVDKVMAELERPTALKNNPDSLQCFVDGITSCPIWEETPGDPNGTQKLGGPGGLTIPKTGTTVADQLVDLIVNLPWPVENPEPNPNPTTSVVPTTSPSTTTTTVVTTTVPDDPCRGGAPSATCFPEPPPEDPPETEDGECFPSGWGWLNPVEWVLKPVKCALLWAFWDQDAADELGELWADGGGDWIDAATETAGNVELTSTSESCWTVPTSSAEVCASDVLNAPVPAPVGTLFAAGWTFALFFELLGLFARITRT